MIDTDVMVKRAMEDCDEHLAHLVVESMMDNWVPELEPNIWEWVEHKPFTDIQIGVVTMNIVINLWGGHRTIIDIGRAVHDFREYIDGGYKDPELFIKCFNRYGIPK